MEIVIQLLSLASIILILQTDLIVDSATSNACLSGPRVHIRASLASFHVPNTALVPQVAHFRIVAFPRSVLQITM